MYNRGFANFILILFGFLLVGIIIGFFVTRRTYSPIAFPNITGDNNSPFELYVENKCGLSITSPKELATVGTTFSISGYANGCGWDTQKGSVGTVVVLNQYGQVVSSIYPLTVSDEGLFSASTFTIEIYHGGPYTDKGSLLFTSTGADPKSLILPIRFK